MTSPPDATTPPHQPGAARPWRERVVALLPWLCGVIAFAIAAKNLLRGGGDLGIYLEAAAELRRGDVDLFRPRETTGALAYPPVAVLPFAGLQLAFGDTAIRWLWSLGLGLATALLVLDLRRAVAPVGGLAVWQWLAFAFLFQRCIAQNLTHGQLSLWVAALMLHGVVQLQRGRDLRGGAWIGAAAALKLTPLLFVAVLPLAGRGRAALAVAGASLLLVYVVPAPFLGLDEHLRLLGDFHRAVLGPLFGHGEQAVLDFYNGHNVGGTLDYALQARPVDREGHLVHVVDLGDTTLRAVKLLWSAAIAALLGTWLWRSRGLRPEVRIAHAASVAMLGIVFFSPLTRAYHLAGAVLPFALFCRGPASRRDALWLVVAAGCAFALTLRQKNLLGETLWRAFDLGGLLHLSLVLMTLWLCLHAARHDDRS